MSSASTPGPPPTSPPASPASPISPDGGRARLAGLGRVLLYVWAGPNSLLGLIVALLTAMSGGRVARSHGVLEAWGGVASGLLRSTPIGAQAMALGHVVLGRDRPSLERTRAHELVHVRQAERWGPLFLPAYLAASAWAWLRGRHFYRDNCFEREARRGERRSSR
jgi:uncharacterized RDD family membrane protein YckC